MSKAFHLHEQPLVAFIATCNPVAAKEFYGAKLGLRLASEGPYALVFASGETMLRIQIVDEIQAADYTVLGWQVPGITAAVADLQAAGIQLRRYQGVEQDEIGIWTSPDGTKVAWFEDPDGNTLSITQI